MSARADRLARAAKLDSRFGFLEGPDDSLPVDRAAPAEEGPLAGLTIGIKANIRVRGQAWTAGIGARAGRPAEADAALVARLRAAGADFLSRLKMDEGALGAATDNPHFGRCDNPALPGHSVGGSSGGSAAAVAAGAVDVALGTDTLGSVRIPAAWCGVWGLKLGHGLVPMDGVFPLAPSLDSVGILARDAGAIGPVLDALAPGPASAPLTAWCQPSEATNPAPGAAAFIMRCADILADMLGPGDAVPLPDLASLRSDAFLLTEIEAAGTLGDEPGLSSGIGRLIDYGRRVTPDRQTETRARLEAAGTDLRAMLGRERVLLLPTVPVPPVPHGARSPANLADFTALANVAGCPALALPSPVPVDGLPVSTQLVGPQGSERALIDLGARLSAKLSKG